MKLIRLLVFCLLFVLSACGDKQTAQLEPESKNDFAQEQPTIESNEQPEPSVEEMDKPIATAKPIETTAKASKQQPTASSTASTPSSTEEPRPSPSTQQVERATIEPATPPTPVSAPLEEKKTESVRLSIRGDQSLGVVLESTDVTYEEGDTVLSVLARTLKEKKIPLDYSGAGRTSYIKGIANLYEFDRGPLSGWLYRVNGVFTSESAGAYKLQPGDRVEWVYTLDLGKDVGAAP